jgi:tetratricopeptide (TPR) repeat protein
MNLHKNIRAFLLHLLVFAAVASFAVAPVAAQSGRDGGSDATTTKPGNDTAKVLELFKQKRFAEAVPYLERMVNAEPNDSDLRFLYGFSLFMKAATASDKSETKKLLAQARQQFVKSKELGSTEETLDELIAMIPPDGGESKSNNNSNTTSQNFSKDKDAEEYMNKGERAFAAKDYDKAFEMYQKALKKDPALYEAALWSGDAMMQKGEFDNAEIWYQKAIQINPLRETAYRYSATPLMKQKKYDQARERYVEAYITEPYNTRALGGLQQWSEVTGIEIGHPRIDIPATVGRSTSGNTSITLGMGDKDDDGSFVWAAYGLARASWQDGKNGLSDNFKKAYPNETVYRHSLAEEYDALKLTVTTLKTRMSEKDNPVKRLNPQLAALVEIYDAGLLESYILLAMKDDGIVQDHPAYLKQNREKLRQYVFRYVFSRPTTNNSVKADG